MQQRFRKLALFVGAATLAAGGLVIVACSTDNGGTTPTPAFDGGGGTKEGGGGGTEAGMNEAGPQPDGGGADADCSKNPVLRDYTTGYRCPFIDAGGADAGANCTNAETCCEPSKVGMTFPPSYCATGAKGDGNVTCKAAAPTFNSSFDAGNAWECADKNACATGQICCMIPDPGQVGKTLGIGNTLATDKNHPPACGVQRAFNEGGSRCRTGTVCPTGEKKLCSLSDDNCAAPTKCTPFVDFQQNYHGTCL